MHGSTELGAWWGRYDQDFLNNSGLAAMPMNARVNALLWIL